MKIIKKFKNWLDMYPSPSGYDGEGWENFNNHCKEFYPIRFWITETFIPNYIWPVQKFFKDIRDWVRFRFFERMHIIDTKLKPDYYDSDTLILHGMFSILVDFVEIEKAWMQAILCEDYKKPWYPFKRFRNPEWGIKYLDWEITLTGVDTSQAEAAKTIKTLYNWWTIERPSRLDPYDLMDGELFPPERNIFDLMKQDDNPKREQVYEQINDLEKQYDDEDTEMLKKLIEVRGSLWT